MQFIIINIRKKRNKEKKSNEVTKLKEETFHAQILNMTLSDCQ
jgi:hypothetical protein